jgi:hypothetical protein
VGGVSTSNADARGQLLRMLGSAADRLAVALGEIGGAYEMLDERSAERMEEAVFRPIQLAYGRLRRTHNDFAARTGLPARGFSPAPEGAPARGVKPLIEAAAAEASAADGELGELQDSMLPVEFGDVEVREGIGEVRRLLGAVVPGTRELLRTFGR